MNGGSVVLTAGAGFGKTTLLEQALADADRRAAWISCSDTYRAPGVLVVRIVDAIADAAPGASDALRERLARSQERVDALAATRELIGELSRLLVEPLVVVVDDAEHLEGAADSLEVLAELIRAAPPPLRVAVASRRPLGLRIAKARVAGAVTT